MVLFMILIYREIYVFKEEFHKSLSSVAYDVRTENEAAMRNIQSNMIKYVHQIKGISADNIKELHKVSAFNAEHITSRPNHFSEIYDSDMRGESDARGKIDIFHKPSDPPMEYYMSEHTRCTHDTDGDDNDGSIDVIECKDGVCPLPKARIADPDDDMPHYSDEKRKNSESIPEYVKPQNSSVAMELLSSPVPMPTVAVIEDADDSDDDETDIETSEDSHPLDEPVAAVIPVEKDDTEDAPEDSNQEVESEADSDDDNDESESLNTAEKADSNHDPKLKRIASYTVAQLKRIALRLHLSTSHKQDGKMKTYKKDDLYNIIRKHLMDNKLSL